MKFTLIATIRNEGPFLLEWLDYHRTIGFTDFLICSNDCVDGSPNLLDRLAEAGLISHIRCSPKPGEKPQLVAYEAASKRLSQSPEDWLMVLDADEYLNIHVGSGTVTDLIAAVPDANAIHINWRIFGSSGHQCWAPGFVTERFTRAASRNNGVNWSFKTLFRNAAAYDCVLLPHGPGFAKAEWLPELHHVNAAGEPLPQEYARAETFLQIRPAVWELAQINHYNTRSWEDYLVKHRRTGGLFRWDRDSNWAIFDCNEGQDLTIQRHLPRLRAGIAELMRIAGIAEAHERCCELYVRHVRQLADELSAVSAAA